MARRMIVIALASLASLATAPTPAWGQDEAEAPPPAQFTEGPVVMLRFKFHDRWVEGRWESETETTLKVASLTGSVIGYPRADITDLERYEISQARYLELQGDHLLESAYEQDDPAAALFKVRRTYLRALVEETDEETVNRVRRKLDLVDAEREDAQAEAIRKERLRRERAETALVEAEKSLAEQKLVELKQQREALAEMHKAFVVMQKTVATLQERQDALLAFAGRTEEALDDLEDDVDDLERRCGVFITKRYIDDANSGIKRSMKGVQDNIGALGKDVGTLRQEVDRLRAAIEKLQNE